MSRSYSRECGKEIDTCGRVDEEVVGVVVVAVTPGIAPATAAVAAARAAAGVPGAGSGGRGGKLTVAVVDNGPAGVGTGGPAGPGGGGVPECEAVEGMARAVVSSSELVK